MNWFFQEALSFWQTSKKYYELSRNNEETHRLLSQQPIPHWILGEFSTFYDFLAQFLKNLYFIDM